MPDADELLSQQAARESNARTYPRHLPITIETATGLVVEDVDGNSYLDCLAGAGSLALGHNHPVVVDAIDQALQNERPHHTLDLTTPLKERFVDTLFESLPDRFVSSAKIQFCSPAGTDAVEAALKLVKTATGNRDVLAFQGGYHGMTTGALSLMGDVAVKSDVSGLMPGVHHLPYPYDYRSPFGSAAGHETASRYVEHVLDDPNGGIGEPAGLITELVQGEGGVIPAPDAWTQEIRRITRERDIPLIVDEIQTGLGRTGELYAFEHADITPDVVTLSKAIGGGLPLSVIVYDERLDVWEPGAHAGTFRGHQLAMAAGQATIEYVLDNDLDEHAAQMGARLESRLERTDEQFDVIGDVRGRGLMLGVEIVDPAAAGGETVDPDGTDPSETPDEHAPPHPEHPDLAKRIQASCLDRGLIIERGGRAGATVRFLPPLTVSKAQIDEIAAIFHEAVVAEAATEGRR
ncbi:diaminobutyrate--2-oxoglutarate transaminase [Halocatena pleomorpha]|uniref:Aminotransferase class III-fold pyridoxal phosphate-dependent enzyme n=1 Tax=Halocatena pleomorpha TaxID=1785090 RepID=A0A3P3R5K7_9EURY|nr:diaminobutyrate--2-oxoglutarate transaminase [Halocatena pleomorpha]RRJ28258.1 aminotransferase class III-fold pyridoxal phosphate-dependent enzyme [Halocatena pleomorpha]